MYQKYNKFWTDNCQVYAWHCFLYRQEHNHIYYFFVHKYQNGAIHAEYLMKHVFMDDYLLNMYYTNRVYQIHDDLTDREYRINMQYGDFGSKENSSFKAFIFFPPSKAMLSGLLFLSN